MIPKISIIMPVYNSEKYLAETVACLLNQTYSNLEIVIVDDGSTDRSPIICDKLAEENENVVVIHQPNKGVSVARNTGMKKATGSLIGFCDSDDFVESDCYEFLYNQMQKYDSDIACCTSKITTGDKSVDYNPLSENKVLWSSFEFNSALLKELVPMNVYTKLFKTEVLKGVSFPENYRINEDKYFCLSAVFNADKISFEPVGKYHYVRREGSASLGEFTEKYFDAIKLGDKIIDIVKESHPKLLEDALCNKLLATIRICTIMYKRNGEKKFAEDEQKILQYIKSYDKKLARKQLRRNDYIRFTVARLGKRAFRLFVKLAENK